METRPATADDELEHALKLVLDYLWTDEERDYLAASRAKRRKHIFSSLCVIRRFLEHRAPRRDV